MTGVLSDLRDWVDGGSRVEACGFSIFHRQDGPENGRPLTMLHGFPTSSHDWSAIIPALTAAGHRVTTLDFLGFGESDKPRSHTFSLFEQADIVEALWKHLGIESTQLVAHDYGVSVAQELLARDSARITSMAWLNGGVFPDLHRPITIQKLMHGRLGPLLSRFASERTFVSAMAQIMARPVDPTDLHVMWESIARDGGTRVQPRLLRYIDERRAHAERWVGALESYVGPTLFVWGPADPISGGHVLPRIAERVPAASVVVLDGPTPVGHYPQVEDPAAVAAALVEFG